MTYPRTLSRLRRAITTFGSIERFFTAIVESRFVERIHDWCIATVPQLIDYFMEPLSDRGKRGR